VQTAAVGQIPRSTERILVNKSFQSYAASLATWDHTTLPVTCHKWTCSA